MSSNQCVPGIPSFPILLNIFLECIMTDALADLEGTMSTRVRVITNLCSADEVSGLSY